MKSTQLKYIVGTAIIMFILTSSAWADGRARSGWGHHKGGHSYKQGYLKKHFGHHYKYKGHNHRNRYHDRHRYSRHHYRHAKPHHRYYKRHHYRPPSHRTGIYFSINDPYFSFGFTTGGH